MFWYDIKTKIQTDNITEIVIMMILFYFVITDKQLTQSMIITVSIIILIKFYLHLDHPEHRCYLAFAKTLQILWLCVYGNPIAVADGNRIVEYIEHNLQIMKIKCKQSCLMTLCHLSTVRKHRLPSFDCVFCVNIKEKYLTYFDKDCAKCLL